jgi:hypothetical protein
MNDVLEELPSGAILIGDRGVSDSSGGTFGHRLSNVYLPMS